MKGRTPSGLVTSIPCGRDAWVKPAGAVLPACLFGFRELLAPLFGGVASRGQRAVHVILR